MNNIKKFIDSSAKTIKQISKETGINYTTLTNYYRNERQPRDTDTWISLANYFRTPVSVLMGIDEIDYTINESNKVTIISELDELRLKEDIIKQLANLDSKNFNGFANLYPKINELVALDFPESHPDYKWITSIIADTLSYTTIYAKQRIFSSEQNPSKRKSLEKEFFGDLSQTEVNDHKSEIRARLGAHFN